MTLCTIGYAQEKKFTLTSQGVGCIQIGMKVTDIPETCEGLYNKVEKKVIPGGDPNDFEAEPAHDQYLFYQGKVKVMEISITPEDEGAIHYLTVYSPHIETEQGLHPGSPIKDLVNLTEGVEWQIEGEYYGAVINGCIAIELKSKYLTPSGLNKYEDVFVNEKEPKFFLKDFKPGSKIEEISVYQE